MALLSSHLWINKKLISKIEKKNTVAEKHTPDKLL